MLPKRSADVNQHFKSDQGMSQLSLAIFIVSGTEVPSGHDLTHPTRPEFARPDPKFSLMNYLPCPTRHLDPTRPESG